MNYEKILQGILDIGVSMLRCGAENFRIDDSLYRMCNAYGFIRSDVFVIPSNIQITVETPEGEILTQIRHIEYTSMDYDKLDYLNNLSRYVCANTPDDKVLHEKYMEVMNRPQQPPYIKYFAGIMGGAGFGVFFGCNFADACLAVVVSGLMVLVGSWLGKREKNLLAYNTIMAFFAETLIIAGFKLNLVQHPDRIMIGIVMLLISALGITTGIRELLQKDYISGSINIMNSILGATGIAFGTGMAMLIFKGPSSESFIVAHSMWVQLISCTIGCLGFAFWFKIRSVQVAYSGVGAFLTWAIYLGVYALSPSNFMATLVGAIFVAFFAAAMARVNKAPGTIFLTASVFPLIPGPNLYYMMYGCLTQNYHLVKNEIYTLVSTCLAIALGFLIVDIIIREYHTVKYKRERLDRI